MNQELLSFLEAQFGAGADRETAMRAAINKGYAYLDIVGAIDAVGQKKKSSTGAPSIDGLYQPGTTESVLKPVTGVSSSESTNVPEYAQQGLGYVYSGAPVSEVTAPLKKRGELASSQEVFVGESQEAFAKQVQDTYKYLGYSEEKSQEATASFFNEASAQGTDPRELWSRTYHVGYSAQDIADQGPVVSIEGRERFQEIVPVADAAWGNMIANAQTNGATLGDIYNATGLRPVKGLLTDAEDLTFETGFIFDAEDDQDAFQGMKRFWNASALRTKISNELSKDYPDYTVVAHYQSELMKVSDDKDYLRGLGKGGVLFEDYVLDAVLTPVLESVLSLALGVGTSWMSSVEDLGTGGGDMMDLLNVGSMASPQFRIGRGAMAGVQSFALSNSMKVLEVMNELGVDTSNAIELDKAFKDKDIVEAAKKRGRDYAIPVAIFDAITASVAGRLQTALVKRGYTTRLAGAAETLLDATLGASGEMAGQISEKGEVYSWGDVALEAIGELAIAAPSRAIETIKRNAKGDNERAYIDFLSQSSVLGEDASVITNTAYMMNYGEAMSIDKNINEAKQALKQPGLSRETRASLREEVKTLTEQKYEILNKNIERVRNLSPEARAQAEQLTSEILSIKSDIKLAERKSKAQKGLIQQLSQKAVQLQSVLKGETISVAPVSAPAPQPVGAPAPIVAPAPMETAPIIQEQAAPANISEAVGARVTYETPSGETVSGTIFDEGGGKLAVEDDNGTIHELGNIDDIGEAQLEEYKLSFQEQNVVKGEDGTSYVINGKTYEFKTNNPESLIARDAEGNPTSVTLYDRESGKQRTFRGANASAIAFDITRPETQAEVAPAPQPQAEPIVEQAAEPVAPIESVAEPAVEPVPTPTPEAPSSSVDYSGQRTSSVAGRVRAGRGIKSALAASINRAASAFSKVFEGPMNVVFHDSLESMEDATGGKNEAWYDGSNTIHLMKNATDNAVKEEFAHAGFKQAIANNQEFRESMLAGLESLANKSGNPVLRGFIKDRLAAYEKLALAEGLTDAEAIAIAQEEAIVGVLADFTANLNQLDASFQGKLRRFINELLYKFGLKDIAIDNNESFISFAEKFSAAYRSGKSLYVNVGPASTINENQTTQGQRQGRARLIDYLGEKNIKAKNIKYLASGFFGNAYLVETADGQSVIKQTYSVNELLLNKHYVDKFGGKLPGLVATKDVSVHQLPAFKMVYTAPGSFADPERKAQTLGYATKEFVQTKIPVKNNEVNAEDFYYSFNKLLSEAFNREANISFDTTGGFRTLGTQENLMPFSEQILSVVPSVIEFIERKFTLRLDPRKTTTIDALIKEYDFDINADFLKVAAHVNAIRIEDGAVKIEPDFVLEFLEGLNDMYGSLTQLGFDYAKADTHSGNLGVDNQPGAYGIKPVLLDIDSATVPSYVFKPWIDNKAKDFKMGNSVVVKVDYMNRDQITEYVDALTEDLDFGSIMNLAESHAYNSWNTKISDQDWFYYGKRVGAGQMGTAVFLRELKRSAIAKKEALASRSRLTPEAVAQLKSSIVPGSRIGQGAIRSKKVDQTPGVDGTLALSMDMARQYPGVYIKNAWFLTQHPMMLNMADDSLVEKKGKKAGMDAVVSEENMLKADAIYAQFVDLAKGNLLFLHDQFGEDVREYAKRWYDGANVIAQDIAAKYNITVEQASGIIAALSPQKDWFMNIDLAYRVVDIIANSGERVFDQDMYEHSTSVKRSNYDKLSPVQKKKKDKAIAAHKAILDGMVGKKFNELTSDLERAIFIRHFDEKYNDRGYEEYNPVGEKVGRATTNSGAPARVAWSSYGIISSAVKAAMNPSAQAISDALGEQHKIRNFYNNIVNPDAQFGDVTMDTHAVGAAELLIVSSASVEVAHNLGASASNVNGISGMYYAFAEAYKLAAEERGILPREMQSITWEAIRLLYKDTFKNAKNRAINEGIWNKFNNNEITIDEARQELLQFGGGIDRPGWYKFVGEAPSRETATGVQPGERTDGAVPAGGRARKSGPGDVGATPGRPAGRARKLRGAAQRFTSLTAEDTLIDSILDNPDNYYTPQVLADIKNELAFMTKAELIDNMSDEALNGMAGYGFTGLKDGDIRILAAIEMLNRLYQDGDTVGYAEQLDRIFQYGTGIAQALRQYAELKSSTHIGLEQMIRRLYERQGIELTEEAQQELTDLSVELFEAQQEYRDMSLDIANNTTNDTPLNEEAIKAIEDRLFKATLAMDNFNAKYAQGWGDMLTQIMQGNLLTAKSQVINLYANLINLTKYAARLLIAAPFDAVFARMKGEEVTIRPSFAAFVHALSRGGRGFYEAGKIARYGVQPGNAEYRMNMGLKPFTSLMLAFASKDKIGLEFDSQRAELDYRAKMLIRGTFGIPAEVMFRLLPLGDRPIYQFVEGNELFMLGRSQGLEGQALRDYLKFPPAEDLLKAQQRALEVTFQDDSALARGAQAFVRQLETGFGTTHNAFLKVFIRSNLPFVKTPANILNQTLRLSNPIFPALRVANLVVKKGSSKDISESIGELAISSIIFMTAKELWEQGLISTSSDQDEPRERALGYSTFPSASINITGLNRWLDGGDPSLQEGDEFYNYMKMGLGGAIMGAQVAGLKMIEKGTRKQDKVLAVGETAPDQQSNDPMDFVGSLFTSSLGTLSNILDQSFLTGVDGLMEVLRNPEPKTFDRYVEGIFKATVSIPLPNQLSTWYRSEREYLPDYRTASLTEKLVNVVNDRMFGVLGDVPIRVNEWGEPIKQTPEGANPLFYNWFDPINGRIGTTDPVKVEIYNLFMATEDPSVIPNVPQQIVSRRLTVPGSDMLIDITPEEANKMMQMLGEQRTQVLREMIEHESWSTYDNETKVVLLNNVYNSVSNGSVNVDKERFNFDWYNYKLDIITERLNGQ